MQQFLGVGLHGSRKATVRHHHNPSTTCMWPRNPPRNSTQVPQQEQRLDVEIPHRVARCVGQ